jgi:hypothetical protein
MFVDPYHIDDPEELARVRKLEVVAEGLSRLADAAELRYRQDPTPENERSMGLAQARAAQAAGEALKALNAIAEVNLNKWETQKKKP